MTWTTREIELMVTDARKLVARELNISSSNLNCPVYIASREEFDYAVIDELQQLQYSTEDIAKITDYYLPFVIAKYFYTIQEIWLLHDKGESIETIIHELLHSIQKCQPNREGIVDYLTCRISGGKEYIDQYELKDWQEIERTSSYQAIKDRLISEGDCEDF